MALTKEQLQARKIGGSDVATILGLNPYKTAYELWGEMTGVIERVNLDDNDAVAAGNIFEDAIGQFYAHKRGKAEGCEIKLRKSNVTLTHPKYKWLTGHIDRSIAGEKRGLEIKNVHWRLGHLWGKQGSDEVAEYYLPQPHTYMLILDYPLWDVAAYFGGSDIRIYTVQRDPEFDEIIINTTHDFWYENVLKGIPPELDYASGQALEALKRFYPGTDGTTIQSEDSLLPWVEVMNQAKEKVSQYEKAADIAKAHILEFMGNAAVLQLPNGNQFTRKLTTRKAYTVEENSYIDFRFKKSKGD